MLFVLIYAYKYPTRLPYHMIFVLTDTQIVPLMERFYGPFQNI